MSLLSRSLTLLAVPAGLRAAGLKLKKRHLD
jgi:hypothetical protein